jgi:hypothetical protein
MSMNQNHGPLNDTLQALGTVIKESMKHSIGQLLKYSFNRIIARRNLENMNMLVKKQVNATTVCAFLQRIIAICQSLSNIFSLIFVCDYNF